MTRQKFTIGAVTAVFALSLTPAWAGQAGSRPNTTGSSSGSAAPRGGDTGSSPSSGSASSGSSSSSGSATSGSSSSSRPSGGFGTSAGARERAPQRPVAVPRDGSSATGAGSSAARPAGRGSDTNLSPAQHGERAVPAYSRPRDGRTPIGRAIARRDAPLTPGSNIIFFQDPFFSAFRGSFHSRYGFFGMPRYGFGFGAFGYDPFLYGGGYGYPSYGGGYGYPSYGAGGYSTQQQGTGALRLRVSPSDAQVYVDGYFVGEVNDFNGIFQRLRIDAGPHRIELRAEGYETVEFEVFVTPSETITYRGEMKPRMP